MRQQKSEEGIVVMAGTDKRKQSLYFPESMLQEIQHEAARLDRSLSWIVQRCVKIGIQEIRKLPSVNDIPDTNDAESQSSDEFDTTNK